MLIDVKIKTIQSPLIKYRRHDGALSAAGKFSALRRNFLYIFYNRLYLLTAVLLAFLSHKIQEVKQIVG